MDQDGTWIEVHSPLEPQVPWAAGVGEDVDQDFLVLCSDMARVKRLGLERKEGNIMHIGRYQSSSVLLLRGVRISFSKRKWLEILHPKWRPFKQSYRSVASTLPRVDWKNGSISHLRSVSSFGCKSSLQGNSGQVSSGWTIHQLVPEYRKQWKPFIYSFWTLKMPQVLMLTLLAVFVVVVMHCPFQRWCNRVGFEVLWDVVRFPGIYGLWYLT